MAASSSNGPTIRSAGRSPRAPTRRPAQWWFADGYTKDASKEDIVITNPFPDVAIVNFELATAEGNRSPSTLQGYPVPGRSVSVVHLDSVVRDDDSVAVGVTSTRGRVVVGRAQRYAGADRAGFTMNLGAPSLTDQAFFADGESGEGIDERYSVFNGSDQRHHRAGRVPRCPDRRRPSPTTSSSPCRPAAS